MVYIHLYKLGNLIIYLYIQDVYTVLVEMKQMFTLKQFKQFLSVIYTNGQASSGDHWNTPL